MRQSSKQREREFHRASPVAAPRKERARNKHFRDYVRWLWPYRFALLFVFILAILTAGLDMVWPLAIKRVIDGVLPTPLASELAYRVIVVTFPRKSYA